MLRSSAIGRAPSALRNAVAGIGVLGLAVAAATLGMASVAEAQEPDPAPPDPPSTLRVLTFNVWGIPGISPDLAARMPKIGDAINALAPDVVLLQEAWHDDTAATLSASLERGGLRHQVGRSAGGTIAFGSTGMLVASRLPLRDPRWVDYESGRLPHTPYHADWAATKAALLFDVDTARGSVRFATTHMQSSYRTGHYEPVRLAQTLQLVEALSGRASHERGAVPPTLVAGDFNYESDEVADRVLRGMLGLDNVFDEVRWDAILFRDGSSAALRVVHAEKVLIEPVRLDSGELVPMSDHPGLWLELELVAPSERTSDALRPITELASQAGQALSDELSVTRWQQRGAVLSFFGFALVVLRVVRRRPWRRPIWGAAWLSICFVGLSYSAYFAWGYAPSHLDAMRRAEARLLELAAPREAQPESAEVALGSPATYSTPAPTR
jgi:endonuclease/exonuclease/phosphatase family metal-dependent hydrolase